MDFIANDLIYTYKGEYDATGAFVLTEEIKATCIGLDGKGKAIININSGKQYLTAATAAGKRWIRIGNTTNTARQAGMFFDSISANAPRFVMYNGLDAHSKLYTAEITHALIGNLNGMYGYTAAAYGSAFGKYAAGFPNITVDSTNGIRIRNYTTQLAQWDISGNILIGQIGANQSNVYITAGALKIRNNITEMITLNADGSAYFKGMIELSGAGGVKITNAGAGSNGFVIDINGIRGYSAVLGLVFDLPTNGSAPTFSSGKIKEVEFEIYTSGVIRTSATVGDGSASSAGLLMNPTGIYGCKANQLLANANVKILADGTFSFTGDTNNQISWNGTTLAVKGSITLTNTISADSITDGTTNKAYTGTEKTKLGTVAANADVTLSAINGELSLTGGGLVLASGGAKIRSGQTAYDTGTGFWIGDVNGTPKFSIGNSTGNKLLWDGTALTVAGTFQTASSGLRVVLDAATNSIKFFDSGGTNFVKMVGSANGIWITSTNNFAYNLVVENNMAGAGNFAIAGSFKGNATDNGEGYGIKCYGVSVGGYAVGVYGDASGGATNWAGYFDNGNVYVRNLLEIHGDLVFTDDLINVWQASNASPMEAAGKTSITTNYNGSIATINGGVNGKIITILCTTATTTFTETGGNLANIPANSITMNASGIIRFQYYSSTTKWICIGVENN
ncbi:MAG: hypothetical protein WC879_03345 [Melioribacteraceae bacterium]